MGHVPPRQGSVNGQFDVAVTLASRRPAYAPPCRRTSSRRVAEPCCDPGHSDPRRCPGNMIATHARKENAMNMHVDIEEFRRAAAPKKIGLLRRMMAFLAKMM